MKINQIITGLNEINMSPGKLASVDSGPATVGLEMEMLVPRRACGITGLDSEPRADQWVTSMESIEEFFSGDNEADAVMETITDIYVQALEQLYPQNWASDHDGFRTNAVKEWFEEEIWRPMSRESSGTAAEMRKLKAEAWDSYINGQERRGSDAYNWYARQMSERPAIIEALIRELTPRMRDVLRYGKPHGLKWPADTDGLAHPLEGLAQVIERLVADEVQWGRTYKSVPRGDHWIVEPDGSVSSEDERLVGAEVISPPRPISQTLASLEKIYQWAYQNDVTTIPSDSGEEGSTGLHINVSVPGEINYLKLVLLLGDRHILKTFGRQYSEYAKSSFDLLKNYSERPGVAEKLSGALLRKLETTAEAILPEELKSDKNVSINPKKGYIEFRGPGGDWLKQPLDVLIDTVRRTARVMEVSAGDQYDREYLKKLYKFLSDNIGVEPTLVDWFINAQDRAGDHGASTGELLRMNQAQRNQEKKP